MNDVTSTTIEKTIFIDAEPGVVWQFLTDKDKLGTWYHPAEQNLALNQPYRLYKKDGDGKPLIWGEVREMRAPERLVTTFCIEPFGESETLLTWTLHPVADGTRLTLVHEGIADASGDAVMQLLLALDAGWDEHFADLRRFARQNV